MKFLSHVPIILATAAQITSPMILVLLFVDDDFFVANPSRKVDAWLRGGSKGGTEGALTICQHSLNSHKYIDHGVVMFQSFLNQLMNRLEDLIMADDSRSKNMAQNLEKHTWRLGANRCCAWFI